MLPGPKDKGVEVHSYLRLSQGPWTSNRPTKSKAITLVEVLVAVAISMVMFSALFMVLNMGEFQGRIGGARIDVQQEVRRALDWMARDMRQTHRGYMDVINETGAPKLFVDLGTDELFSEPEFQLCEGYNVSTGTTEWSDYTIRYDYDAANHTIIRKNIDIASGDTQESKFNNINGMFFTCIDNLGLLRVDISGRKIAKSTSSGEIVQYFNLSEEIRLRND